MNKQYVLDRIRPYLKNKSITEKEFDSLFSNLELRQQYKVINILIEEGIDIIYDEMEGQGNDSTTPTMLYVYVGEDKKFSSLTNEQLCALYDQGYKKAMEALVVKNQGLVRSRVLRYIKAYKNSLDFDDLYQFGMMGLMKAIQKFDVKKGYHFTTYAVWWIDQAILRGIMDQSSLIRIPVHLYEKLFKLLFIVEHKDYLTKDEIYENYFSDKMSREQFDKLMYISKYILNLSSLNECVGEDKDTELIEFICDENSLSVEKEIETKFMRKDLEDVLNTISPREKMIIRLRFGLEDGRPRTLEEIGEKLGVTRERIRQIEAKAIRKLRHPSRSKKLRAYIEE